MQIKLKQLHANARLPEFAHPGEDACADLYCVEDVVLKPGEPQAVPLGFSIEVPIGYEAQIRPRSGLALKHGLTIPNSPGTVDSGYRAEVKVILLWGGFAPNGWLCDVKAKFPEGDGDPWWPAATADTPRIPCPDCKPALRFPSGSRIAQLAIRRTEDVAFEWAEELEESRRGEGGFGSTGVVNG